MIENIKFFAGLITVAILLQTWPCFDIAQKMIEDRIVPDVLPVPPHEMCNVTYRTNVSILAGNKFYENYDFIDEPTVKWDADPNKYYLVVMTNPDIPNRTYCTLREYHHWLVGNIPGDRMDHGEVLSAYLSPDGKREYDWRRHIFLVYEQPKKLDFDEPRCDKITGMRGFFRIYQFAQKYKLGDPLCGNYFLAVD